MSKSIAEVSMLLPQEGFVRLPVILKVLSIGKTTWWCGVRDGTFPKPIKMGKRTARWNVKDIRALIAKYIEEANNGE